VRTLQQVAILIGPEHVADGGDENQVESLAERIRAKVTEARFDAKGEACLLDVALGNRENVRKVQQNDLKRFVGLRKGNGIGARTAADVEHFVQTLDANGLDHMWRARLSVVVHRSNKGFRPISARPGGFLTCH